MAPGGIPVTVLTRFIYFSILFTMAAVSGDGNDVAELLDMLLRIIKEERVLNQSDDQPVVQFVQPEELKHKLPISLGNLPASKQEIEMLIRQIIQYSVKTCSPHFHNQLYAGVDKYGLVGSWLTDALNTSQYTYEVAPVFTLMEQEIIDKSLALVGYSASDADGIMTPGGSMSNMYGMMLARNKVEPSLRERGMQVLSSTLVCFTSEDSHYSILKAAHWLGIGIDNVYKVKTNKSGRMEPSALKMAINEARERKTTPFFVNATCGTTVLGAIDPLLEIAKICQREDIWLHVDACLGGTLLLSEKHRSLLCGIELSNSVAWNPHKMLGVPLQCSLFLVKGKDLLYEANHIGADYLFQQDKCYDTKYDTGDKSVQCGRKVDAAKFWLMWKARGTDGLANSVDHAMFCANYFVTQISNIHWFRLVIPQFDCSNVCFWYIPPSMRGQEQTEQWWTRLSTITVRIKKRMLLEGSLMISYAPLPQKNIGNFFRMVVNCQPPPSTSSMDHVINTIQAVAADM